MHYFEMKKIKQFYAPPPVGRGTPPPHTPPLGAFGASILAPSALDPPTAFVTNRTLTTGTGIGKVIYR